MRRLTTLAAFAGTALLNGAAFSAQNHGLAAYQDNDALSIKVSIDDADGPARDRLAVAAFRDTDAAALDFSAAASQGPTRLALQLAIPANEHAGAEFIYVDVLEPAGFRVYEIIVRVADLKIFVYDYSDGAPDAAPGPDLADDGADFTDGSKLRHDPGQDVPIGNPYGDDVLFEPGPLRPVTANPQPSSEFDFGDGGTDAATIPVDHPAADFDPSADLDDFNPGSDPGQDPPIGNPYGDDMVWPDSPLEDFNSQPAQDTGDGSGGGADPFAPGDGDLGSGADDLTMTAGPSPKSVITIIEPSLAVNTGDSNADGLSPTAAEPQAAEEALDCNNNGQADHLEIAADPGLDMDGDGLIDRCSVSGDLDGSGAVDVMDLITLLTNWGSCLSDSGCEGDLTVDGLINEDDLAFLFDRWTN